MKNLDPACLLGIFSPDQLHRHAVMGALSNLQDTILASHYRHLGYLKTEPANLCRFAVQLVTLDMCLCNFLQAQTFSALALFFIFLGDITLNLFIHIIVISYLIFEVISFFL